MKCSHCERTDIQGHGLCQMHYGRWRRGQDLDAPKRTGGIVKGQMAHLRVKARWGPARDYPCVECKGRAEEWAYNGLDPDELSDPRGPYSIHAEFYSPMCVPCHRAFDAKGRATCTECGAVAHAKKLCKKHYDSATQDRHNALKRLRNANRKLVSHH